MPTTDRMDPATLRALAKRVEAGEGGKVTRTTRTPSSVPPDRLRRLVIPDDAWFEVITTNDGLHYVVKILPQSPREAIVVSGAFLTPSEAEREAEYLAGLHGRQR